MSVRDEVYKYDPVLGTMPPRQLTGPRERVLHVHLTSRTDQQESQVRALMALGSDGYVSVPARAARVRSITLEAAMQLRPSVVFVQIQRPGLNAAFFRQLREAAGNSNLVICHWSGDINRHNAPNPTALSWVIEAAPEVDLTLWSSWTHVEILRNAGVTAAYLQVGYEDDYFFEEELPATYDVTFLFNEYSQPLRASMGPYNDCDARTEAAEALLKHFKRATVGATHPVLMAAGDAYRRSKLAVSISASQSLERYTSNRLFRAMACTATAVKQFPDYESFGLKHEENCLLFDSTEELIDLAKTWLGPVKTAQLRALRHAGAKLIREHHTWGVRVQELRPLIAAVREGRRRAA